MTVPHGSDLESVQSISPAQDQRRRVLLVDDNEDSTVLLGEFLTEMQFDVRTAGTAREALDIAADWSPEIAVLDIGLPDQSGYDLARQLRTLPDLSGLRLIAVTGYVATADPQRARDAGFEHHLMKPVPVATLVKLLRD